MTGRQFAVGCGTVVVVLFLVAGCGLAKLYEDLPAGDRPKVDFDGAEISAARAAMVTELEAQLEGVERRYGIESHGGRARIDWCERGFDDFTRQDQYAYSCRMALAELLPVREPFESNASRLGEALLEGDCPDGTDTDLKLAEAFGDPRQIHPSHGSCQSGFGSFFPQIADWLAVPTTRQELESVGTLDVRCTAYPGEYAQCDLGPLHRASPRVPARTAALAPVEAGETYYLVAWKCDWPASWFRRSCRNRSYAPSMR
jgi:hypothetical protein